MSLTSYSGDTDYIASLDDLPNDVGGLTAAQLKAKFDQFGTEFVAWFNGTHLPEIASASVDDWAPVSDTWTYASANTITVPSGATAKYQVGDRVKFTQTTVKYGIITAVTSTLITLAANIDYSVASAPISSIYASHSTSPIGFPQYFRFTPSYTNLTVGNATTNAGYFTIIGRRAYVKANLIFGSTTAVTGLIQLTTPITKNSTIHALYLEKCGTATAADSSASLFYYLGVDADGRVVVPGTNGLLANTSSTSPFTWAVSDGLSIEMSYFIA